MNAYLAELVASHLDTAKDYIALAACCREYRASLLPPPHAWLEPHSAWFVHEYPAVCSRATEPGGVFYTRDQDRQRFHVDVKLFERRCNNYRGFLVEPARLFVNNVEAIDLDHRGPFVGPRAALPDLLPPLACKAFSAPTNLLKLVLTRIGGGRDSWMRENGYEWRDAQATSHTLFHRREWQLPRS